MNDDEKLVVFRSLERIEKLLNRIDADLAEDRKDLDKLLIRSGTIQEQNHTIIDLSARQTKKLGEKVEDAIENQMEQVKEEVQTVQEMIGGEK